MKLSIVLLLGICLAVASASNIRGDTPAEQETHDAVLFPHEKAVAEDAGAQLVYQYITMQQ